MSRDEAHAWDLGYLAAMRDALTVLIEGKRVEGKVNPYEEEDK